MEAGQRETPASDTATKVQEHDQQESRHSRDAHENTPQDALEERNLRRLKVMMQLLLTSITQDRSITIDEAAQMVANTRNATLRMFPGKESTFNLLCRPRIQRAMRERFQIQ